MTRLEEERRKLENAHREFAEFVENVRKSKDREEFERFMNERRNRPNAREGLSDEDERRAGPRDWRAACV